MFDFRERGDVDGHEVAATFPVDATEDFVVLRGIGCEEMAGVGVEAVCAFVGMGVWVGEWTRDHG